MLEEIRVNNRFEIIKGDITKLKVDAIVNAANTSLLGGGGVDGAIHRAAGNQLLEECKKMHGCETGQAKITSGYKLHSKYVIHTPGPIWKDGNCNEPDLLKNCYQNSLMLAVENECRTVAFPSISTGVYSFPLHKAAKIAIDTIFEFLESDDILQKVTMVCLNDKTFEAYENELVKYLEKNDEKFIDDDVEALLISDLNGIKAQIIMSMLESYGIPVLKKSRGSGGIMEIYSGINNFGIDIYVPSKMLKKAQELIDSESAIN